MQNSIINKILDSYPDEIFIQADGFDDAIIGLDEEIFRLIYSTEKCLEILRKSMGRDEAIEFFYFNVAGVKGERFPIYCQTFSSD